MSIDGRTATGWGHGWKQEIKIMCNFNSLNRNAAGMKLKGRKLYKLERHKM
jgi:hypothetical protein